MRAAVLDRLGQPPAFQSFDSPEARDDETLVDVRAAAIKQLDRAIAAGRHYSTPKTLPVVCGTDGVGRAADGARVYFYLQRRPFGAMAERAPAALTVTLPDAVDDVLAAALVNPALAAWLPLVWRAKLQPGERVLVLGATGASGRLAVRAARLLGASRIVAAGRNQKVLRTLDADAAIDLTLPPPDLKEAFRRELAGGLDVVVDFVWGPVTEQLISVLVQPDLHAAAHAGDLRLVQVGAMGGPNIALPGGALRGARLTILGSGTGNYPPPKILRTFIADILARAARGEIGVETVARPLSEAAEAWAAPDDGRRIVLTV
jgi:NADPH:quinone reductase-like Zn-dependent oxidoreductase